MACCWRGSKDPEEDADINPIYNYLKRNGWDDSSLSLLKCTRAKLPRDFSLKREDFDPFKVVMRPVEAPTELFKALQIRDWGRAIDCLHKKPSEAKTWIYRETDFPESEMLWMLLPLHAAIALGAPAYLIIELIDIYPDAAKKWDLHKSLPIHIAASRIDRDADGERVLNCLLHVFPEAAGVEDGKGKIPIELAYGAQLRKDKQDKINIWSIETRGPEGGGFELQLEMRDVMESFNNVDKTADPSTWSLGTIPTTSSFSTKSAKTSYSFLNSIDGKLRTIDESFSIDGSNLFHASTSSDTSATRSSIGLNSIHLNKPSASIAGSSSFNSTSSSRSMAYEPSGLSRASSSTVHGKSFPSGSTSTSHFVDQSSSIPSNESELSENDSCKSSKASSRRRHHRQKGLKRVHSLSSLRRLLTRSRSTEHESISSANTSSIDSKSNIGPIDLDASIESGVLTAVARDYQQMKLEGDRRARSFELPAAQVLQSSPVKSLPSPRKKFFVRCRSVDEKKTNLSGVSTKTNDSSVDKSSNFIDLSVTASLTSRSSDSEQQQSCNTQAKSFDLSPKKTMYTSPSRSLPIFTPTMNLLSLSIEEEPSSSEFGVVEENGSSTECEMMQGTASISVSSNVGELEQQRVCWRQARLLHQSSQESEEADKTPKMHPKDTRLDSTASRDSRDEDQQDCSILDEERHPKEIRLDSSTASRDSRGVDHQDHSDRSILDEESDSDESESDDSENGDDDNIITDDLVVLTEVRNSFDEKPLSPGSLSGTEDPILVDFVQEAISNIGEEKFNIKWILNEMRANRISSIEDLLQSNSKDFAAAFPCKELAMEMQRLLNEPNYESLDCVYEDEDILCSTSSGSTESSGFYVV